MIERSFFSLTRPRLTCPALSSGHHEVVEIPLPAKAHVHLDGAYGGAEEVSILRGKRVKTGQRIALNGNGGRYFISPVAGVISRTSSVTGYLGRRLIDIAFDVDREDLRDEDFSGSANTPPMERISRFLGSLPGQKDFASVVGFQPPLKTVVVHGIDQEVLVSTNRFVVQTRLEDLAKGIRLLKQVCSECRIILLAASNSEIKAETLGAEVMRVTPTYPDLLPKVIMKRLFGLEVPAGSRCEEMGIGFLSAEAVACFGAAFSDGQIPVHKTLTVIKKDSSIVNVRARIGTPLRDILKALDIATRQGDRLILGGPMRGLAVYSEETPVLADTDALMVQDSSRAAMISEAHCVNCGECVRICPAKMPVNMLIRVLENRMYEEAAQTYDLLSCVECGLCSYVCIARIPVFHYVMLGKHEYGRMKTAEGSNA